MSTLAEDLLAIGAKKSPDEMTVQERKNAHNLIIMLHLNAPDRLRVYETLQGDSSR